MGGPQRLRGSGDERRQQSGGRKRGDDCESAAREGRQARYYQFTMPQSADITVLLESEDADTVLYLREGAGVTSGATTSGGFNEGESEYNYRRASIEQTLAASTHQHPHPFPVTASSQSVFRQVLGPSRLARAFCTRL